ALLTIERQRRRASEVIVVCADDDELRSQRRVGSVDDRADVLRAAASDAERLEKRFRARARLASAMERGAQPQGFGASGAARGGRVGAGAASFAARKRGPRKKGDVGTDRRERCWCADASLASNEKSEAGDWRVLHRRRR